MSGRLQVHRAGMACCIASLLVACMPAPPSTSNPVAADCVVVDDAARARITIAAAPAGPDPFDRAPDRITRMVAAQLYETLVSVTCDGRVVPALAESWSSDDSLRWRFRIAKGRRFGDGTPIDAHSVIAAWSTAGTPLLAGVTAAGTDIVDVRLHEPAGAELFALAALSIMRAVPGHEWPAGTGPYRVDTLAPDRTLRLIAGQEAVSARLRPDTLVFRTFAGDMRAAIDAGVDVLIARDASTLAYARARSDYTVAPLPWNRTWVLASAPADAAAEESRVPRVAAADRNAPAARSDATRGDSTIAAAFPEVLLGVPVRAPVPPFWWTECSVPKPGATRSGSGHVLYQRGDMIGRAIAERVAALARGRAPAWLRERLGPGAGAVPTAVGVSEPELVSALRSHTALAVVMSVPRERYSGCGATSPAPVEALMSGWRMTPLIETRDALVYRPGIGRVTVHRDGMPRFGELRSGRAGAR